MGNCAKCCFRASHRFLMGHREPWPAAQQERVWPHGYLRRLQGGPPRSRLRRGKKRNFSSRLCPVSCFPLVEFHYVRSQLLHISVSSGAFKGHIASHVPHCGKLNNGPRRCHILILKTCDYYLVCPRRLRRCDQIEDYDLMNNMN